MRLLSNLAPLVLIAGLVLLALTGSFRSPPIGVVAVQVLAIAFGVWARTAFPAGSFRAGPAPGGSAVMRRGPYAIVRHPMYLTALVVVWSAVLAQLDWRSAAVGAAVSVCIAARIVHEERLLRTHFGEYAEYARSTKAVIPFII